MIVSNYKMNQIDDVFKNEMSNEIEELFNGNESKLIEAIVALNLGLNLIKKKKYKVKKIEHKFIEQNIESKDEIP